MASGATLCTAVPIERSRGQKQSPNQPYKRVLTWPGTPTGTSTCERCDQTMVSANKVQPEMVSRGDSVPFVCVHSDTMQYPTAEVEIKMGHWVQRVKVAIAPSLPVDVLLGQDIFCPEVGQQLGLGLAVVTRSQARQGSPQGVTPPPLDHDSGGVEAKEEVPVPRWLALPQVEAERDRVGRCPRL